MRRPRVEITSLGEIVVVLPRRFSPHCVADILREHRDWVERTRTRMRRLRERNPARYEAKPRRIELGAANQTWHVEYEENLADGLIANHREQHLLLRNDQPHLVQLQLRAWLQVQAQHHLIPWLARKSREIGLPYLRASVRAQKTRWGSCSSRKVININRALLFLPPALVDYILVHELCHTVHMNHSRHFWALVERHCPAWHAAELAMRRANEHVPIWALSEN